MTVFFIRLTEDQSGNVWGAGFWTWAFLTGELLFSCAILTHSSSLVYGVFDYQLEYCRNISSYHVRIRRSPKLSTEIIIIIIIIITTTTTVIILQFKRAACHIAGNDFFVLSRNRSPGVISDLSTVVAVSSKLWRHVTVFQTFLIPSLLTFPFSEGKSLCILKRIQCF